MKLENFRYNFVEVIHFFFLFYLIIRFCKIILTKRIYYETVENYIIFWLLLLNYNNNYGREYFRLIALLSIIIQHLILININNNKLKIKKYYFIMQHSGLLGFTLVRFLNKNLND